MKFRQMGKREVNLIIHRVIKDTTVPCSGCYENIEKRVINSNQRFKEYLQRRYVLS